MKINLADAIATHADHDYIGHPHGSCLISHDHRVVYLNIPKCGSTLMKQVLVRRGFEHHHHAAFHKPDDYVAFSILRHPVARTRSAIEQFFVTQGLSEVAVSEGAAATVAQAVREQLIPELDAHTIPQVDFFHSAIPLDAVFVLEDLETMRQWLASHGVDIEHTELSAAPNRRENPVTVTPEFENLVWDQFHVDCIAWTIARAGTTPLSTVEWRP